MKFSLIAAVDSKLGIGKNGHLPWRLPSDLTYYHDKTVGNGNNAVIMGRLTWESLPQKFRPLPKRKNIVITRNPEYALPQGVLKAENLEQALALAEGSKPEEIFVIGGSQIFGDAILHPDCAALYLTEIEGNFACDTFFPKIPAYFKKTLKSEVHEENGIRFKFCVYRG